MAIEHGAPFPVPEERRSLRRFLGSVNITVASTRSGMCTAGAPVRNSSARAATSSPTSIHGKKNEDAGSSTNCAPAMPFASCRANFAFRSSVRPWITSVGTFMAGRMGAGRCWRNCERYVLRSRDWPLPGYTAPSIVGRTHLCATSSEPVIERCILATQYFSRPRKNRSSCSSGGHSSGPAAPVAMPIKARTRSGVVAAEGCHEEAVLGTQNGWSVEANGVNHRDKIVDLLLGYWYVAARSDRPVRACRRRRSTETAKTTKKGRGSGILPKHVEL